jgi:hypothetical protein
MSNGFKKICNLLAAADISEREVMDFITELERSHVHDIVTNISAIKKMLKSGVMDFSTSLEYDQKPYHFQLHSDTEKKIASLLLDEASLPKTMAVSLMTEELSKRYHVHIPPESRKGFTNWIRKLQEFIPESELLHVATRIRNNFVHDQDYDWRLSK